MHSNASHTLPLPLFYDIVWLITTKALYMALLYTTLDIFRKHFLSTITPLITQTKLKSTVLIETNVLCGVFFLGWTLPVKTAYLFAKLLPRLDFDSSLHSISYVFPASIWTICQHTAAPWGLHSHTAARHWLACFTTNKLQEGLRSTEEKAGRC